MIAEAGQIEAELKELQEAVRAYIVARDALDTELFSHNCVLSEVPEAIAEMNGKVYDAYEELRTLI